MNLIKHILTLCLFIMTGCSAYYINYPNITTMKDMKIMDTLNFKNFDFYRREELYIYPEQQRESKVGIHYLLIERSNTSMHKVLNLVPIKPFRSHLHAPQYESNFDNDTPDTLILSHFIIYQMGYLYQNKIVFTNQRKKRSIVPTLFVDTTNNTINVNKIYYPEKGTYNASDYFPNGIAYIQTYPKISVELNPDKNCGISKWDVDDEFYLTSESILFKFLKTTCDSINYFSFKRLHD